MFAADAMSNQQITTLYAIGAFLIVAPVILGLAALLGYLHRASRPVG